MPRFRLVQPQGRSSDTSGEHKNASGSDSIPLKRGASRSQMINLAPPRKVRTWRDGPLRLKKWISLIRETRLLGLLSSRVKQSQPNVTPTATIDPKSTASPTQLVKKGHNGVGIVIYKSSLLTVTPPKGPLMGWV